ncbi:uncharacterized protein [Miscanthus floridulus]|uniref:uncharacterized protein isoform X2 n=1 Tax=Miscanthus floridulus TaxID=154761 RepID=UPI003459D1A8
MFLFLEELPNTTPLEESIPDSAPTVPHETIGSSSSTSTSTCQKPVAAAADSTYAPGLQEPDGPSLDEFLDNSSGQKLVEGVVSSLEKLHDTSTSYEESNIADPQTMTQNTIDGSLRTLPSRSEKFVAGAADSTSILTLQEPDVSSSDEYLDSSSEELITASPRTVPLNTIDDSPPTLGPNILIYYPANSFEVFYIRIDRTGSIWIYPNVGGPFQSIDETENAIISFLDLWQCETRTVNMNIYIKMRMKRMKRKSLRYGKRRVSFKPGSWQPPT